MDDPRTTLLRLSAERGETLSELSRMLRRNVSYLQQFVRKGSPRRLADDDIALLARHLGIDAAALGGTPDPGDRPVSVPYLAVRAAAGQGLAADETLIRSEPFAPALLRETGVTPANASLVTAAGESMAPGILDGDRLLVDRGDRRVDGICVFRRDALIAVKRLSKGRNGITLASDNPGYPTIVVPSREVTVIGRVKLLIRRPA